MSPKTLAALALSPSAMTIGYAIWFALRLHH
ncbi:hypothetical protein AWB71_03266 [Caballeronia peredens]|nr:hypothetical protein AWB71_03266 [Caballeronia peredens]